MKMNQQPFDPNQYPGFWEQMNNFKDFLKEVGQGVAEDGTLWSDKTMEERRQYTCERCTEFDHQRLRCTACGCFMKAKWKFERSKCPLDKWEK
jgi:hypothetical protein